jgi:hypothetical protein
MLQAAVITIFGPTMNPVPKQETSPGLFLILNFVYTLTTPI